MKKEYAGFFSNYKKATATELWQVYGKHSSAKDAAMRYCKEM